MKRIISLTSLSLLIIALSAYSQVQDNYILITADSRIQIPAKEITFSIDLSKEDTSSESAYKGLKKIESNFVQLLKEFNLPDSNISYSLTRFERTGGYNKNPLIYRASEHAVIRLNYASQYEQFQMKLLAIGINSFSSQFYTTEVKKYRESGFTKALDNAKEQAEQICRKIKRKLGKILEVESSNKDYVVSSNLTMMSLAIVGEPKLIDIPQHLTLITTVNVKYQLK